MAKSSSNNLFMSVRRFISIAVLLGPAAAQNPAVANFSLYPSGARTCLSSAATSSNCDQSTVAAFNTCVCNNGGSFIDTAAACLGSSSPSDLTTTYAVLSRNCADSNTPINYSLDTFLARASATTAAATATTSTRSSVTTVTRSGTTQVSTQITIVVTSVAPSRILSTITIAATDSAGRTTVVPTVLTLAPLQSKSQSGSTASSSSSSSAGAGSGGLSQGAAIGIGVGVGVPIALALFGILGILLWRRKKNQHNLADGKAPFHDSSPGTTLQSDSPYGQYAGVAAYKQSPLNSPAYSHNPLYNTQPPTHGTGYMSVPSEQQPVELAGTPIYPPQELPGDSRLGSNEKRPY